MITTSSSASPRAATIPVINGLSDSCHPCQLLADVQTMQERFGDVKNLRVAWIGDGNNVCHSYLEAANIFEFDLTVAVPSSYKPAPEWIEKANGRVTFVDSPEEAEKMLRLSPPMSGQAWAKRTKSKIVCKRSMDIRSLPPFSIPRQKMFASFIVYRPQRRRNFRQLIC